MDAETLCLVRGLSIRVRVVHSRKEEALPQRKRNYMDSARSSSWCLSLRLCQVLVY